MRCSGAKARRAVQRRDRVEVRQQERQNAKSNFPTDKSNRQTTNITNSIVPHRNFKPQPLDMPTHTRSKKKLKQQCVNLCVQNERNKKDECFGLLFSHPMNIIQISFHHKNNLL